VPVVCDQLVDLAHSVTDQELDRARAPAARRHPDGAREHVVRAPNRWPRQMLVHGRPIPVAELLQKLEAVSLEDIKRVARTTPQAKPTVVTLGPGGTLDAFEAIRSRLG